MRDATTWLKLDRNIEDWRWYQDANTFRVFIHLLIHANIRQSDYQLDKIERGEVAITIGNIASALNITYKSVRTALNHLETTGEVAIKRRPKYLVISIINYERYQHPGNQTAIEGQSTGNQRANEGQYPKNIRNKEYKNTPQTPRGLTEEEERMRRVMWGSWRPEDDERGN